VSAVLGNHEVLVELTLVDDRGVCVERIADAGVGRGKMNSDGLSAEGDRGSAATMNGGDGELNRDGEGDGSLPPVEGESTAPSAGVDPSLASVDFLRLIPREFARQHVLFSQGCVDGVEQLAVSDRTNAAAAFNVGVRLTRPVATVVRDGEAIARAIDAAWANRAAAVDAATKSSGETGISAEPHAAEDLDALIASADRDLLSTSGKGPVVRLVDSLIFEALGRSASDIHIQPLDDRALVRIRLDGVLVDVRELPGRLVPAVVSRIKIMGRMDIAERRVPQDGRASVTIAGRSVDLRISTLPTSHGERAVLRLLDTHRSLGDFDSLGMPGELAERFLAAAGRSHGLILVTGPTGSGKTTTLYATLRRTAHAGLNVMTIEDPIEYELSSVKGGPKRGDAVAPSSRAQLAISQAQVNTRKGVTFATGLRHILRQDPDVIMVGEIRDAETARIAVQSSLTGHLVFSTLHTNDAVSAVTRLIDLGVEPYLVASSISAVLAQRLVRLRHGACDGAGCDQCGRTGYRGRTGVFELLPLDESLRELIGPHTSLDVLRRAAAERGMRTLAQEGRRLVAEGRTTQAEIARVILEESA
jgi:general secretion pathway protein E